jgi:hypothetical protein
MVDVYPPMQQLEGEDRFDHWVAAGLLHKEEVLQPFSDGQKHAKGSLGHRTVYYTPKGEEWRIPASKLIWEAASKSGGWNEHFERLKGMLFGYEDWQNDWWINTGLNGDGFGEGSVARSTKRDWLGWRLLDFERYRLRTSRP